MKKITRESILNASIEVLKKRGNEGLSVRNIATELGCSTQPIYSEFKNKNELETALFEEAKSHYNAKIKEYFSQTQIPKYKAFGLGFVKFAKDEKELFKFLFMQKKFQSSIENINYDEIINIIQNACGISKETARKLHGDMTIYSYGLAVLENLELTNFKDDELSAIFTNEFEALCKHYINSNNN